MMKEQKRLGNKGFSLVELIVVIAIMAILVAVLAPTLLSKIEDSREGTDLQALGEINTAIKEAILSSETANDEMPDGDYTVTIDNDGKPVISGTNLKDGGAKVNAELQRTIPEVKFKSKLAKDTNNKIKVVVGNGTVTTTLVNASDETVNMSNGEPFEVK